MQKKIVQFRNQRFYGSPAVITWV